MSSGVKSIMDDIRIPYINDTYTVVVRPAVGEPERDCYHVVSNAWGVIEGQTSVLPEAIAWAEKWDAILKQLNSPRVDQTESNVVEFKRPEQDGYED